MGTAVVLTYFCVHLVLVISAVDPEIKSSPGENNFLKLLQKRQPQACSRAAGGLPKYRCPTLDPIGSVRCIDDSQLCNHVPDCPEGEDEQPSLCLFYKVIDRDLRALFDFIVNRFETHVRHLHR